MKITAANPDEYIANLVDDRKEAVTELRNVINRNIPPGFVEQISYGMIGWVVPHSIYPAGYHCDPKLPLPFVSLASQKSHIAVYHMGVNSTPGLLEWFEKAWAEASPRKLDKGGSCIRFKKPEHIPFALIGELMSKITPEQWITTYERTHKS